MSRRVANVFVRETKLLKNRLAFFGLKQGARLREYLQQQEQRGRPDLTKLLFSFNLEQAELINPAMINQTFHAFWHWLELKVPAESALPRLHCLRYLFAIGTLLYWTTPASILIRACGIFRPSWDT